MSYKNIELFAGCGGLGLGLELAGIDSVLYVEKDKDCTNTLKLNRPQWNVVCASVENIDYSPYRGFVDSVTGGFPCQAFSHAGKRQGFKDKRGNLFFEFARCLYEVRPKVFMIENVKGLLTHDKGETLKIILETLSELNYRVEYRILQAHKLGVPQKRERLVIFGVLNHLDVDIEFPRDQERVINLKEALEGCPDSKGVSYSQKKSEVLELVPSGGNWKSLPIDIQKSYMGKSFYSTGGRTGIAKRLSWDEPCLTLTCSPSQMQTERCHPEETRPLTIREYARVQTFPDSWEFLGSISSQYKQIGNAVPVEMGRQLGNCLKSMLEKARNKNGQD